MKKSVFIKQVVIICVFAIALFCMTGCESSNVHIFGNHSYTTETTEPTCTEKGFTTYICSCGYTYVDDYVDALGHIEVVDAAASPTCTETGLTEGSHCSVCETVIVAQEVVPAGHNYGEPEIITNANCFNDGEQKLSCENCDYEEIQIINKLEHEFALVEGTELNECSLCGAVEFKGHLYMAFVNAPQFAAAEEFCEGLGGHLVTITSQEEQDAVNYIIENANYPEWNNSYAFWFITGAKRVNSKWTWITGEEFTYTNWGAKEPDGAWEGQSYIALATIYEEKYNTHHNIGTWEDIHDIRSDRVWGCICEWEPEE